MPGGAPSSSGLGQGLGGTRTGGGVGGLVVPGVEPGAGVGGLRGGGATGEVGRFPDAMAVDGAQGTQRFPQPPSLLAADERAIDLNTALRLANVQNPQLLIARQRVVLADAMRQYAAAQLLPTLNVGTNFDTHTGVLQQSNGNILSLNRSALYVGAGANAIAAGTVNIPGIFLSGNVATTIFNILTARQFLRAAEFASVAERNQAFLATTTAYCELLRGEGRRAVSLLVANDARVVARLTRSYAAAGQGTNADADRAATELGQRTVAYQEAEGDVLVASARLCEVLNIDPSTRLHPTDAYVVPAPIIPDPMPVAELIALGLLRRPELAERRAQIEQALLYLESQRVLPFSPTILIGFSGGAFGGGSNLVNPVFGGFGGRTDFDTFAFWSLQNLGVGNLALINIARAKARGAEYHWIAMMDRVRAEVAESYARTHVRYAQIATAERAVRSSLKGFSEDLKRIEGFAGERNVNSARPIELLDSMRLLAVSRYEYLNAIVDYNIAQFQLFVALGQPPADALAHVVPTEGVGNVDAATPEIRANPPTMAPPGPGNPGAGASLSPRGNDPRVVNVSMTGAPARAAAATTPPAMSAPAGADNVTPLPLPVPLTRPTTTASAASSRAGR